MSCFSSLCFAFLCSSTAAAKKTSFTACVCVCVWSVVCLLLFPLAFGSLAFLFFVLFCVLFLLLCQLRLFACFVLYVIVLAFALASRRYCWRYCCRCCFSWRRCRCRCCCIFFHTFLTCKKLNKQLLFFFSLLPSSFLCCACVCSISFALFASCSISFFFNFHFVLHTHTYMQTHF